MALMEISVIPLGTGNTSFSRWISAIIKEVESSGLEFQLNDMGTVIRGEVSDLLSLASKLHETPFENGARRVYTVIKLDDRRDKETGIGNKVESVLQILNQ